MKTMLAVLFASAFLIGGACAQSLARSDRTADASPSAMMKSDAKRNAEVDKHIKDLHAKLKITPAEESQWEAVARAMRDNAEVLDRAIDKREAVAGTGSAVDDLNSYGEIVQTHANNIKNLSAAFASLYASMPEEQKKLADEVFAQRTRAHEGKKVATK